MTKQRLPHDSMLDLFRRREKEIDRGLHDPEPIFPDDLKWRDKRNRAVRKVQQDNPGDPTAPHRARLRIETGLVRPDNVLDGKEKF